MQRAPKGRRQADPRQGDFLRLLDPHAEMIEAPAPVEGDPDQLIRDLINKAIKVSNLDRDQIAEGMTARVGREITKAMLDCWTGASRPHRFPLSLAPAFCWAAGNTILLAGVLEMAGCRLVEGEELQLARLGQLWLFIERARTQQAEIIGALPLFREARHG